MKEMGTIQLQKYESIPEKYTGIVEYSDGSKSWYKEGKLHREDGPASETKRGERYWFKEGVHHRLDGPAIDHKVTGGKSFWYIDGNKCFDGLDYNFYIKRGVYIGIEVRKYGIEWIRFFTDKGIKEFPIHPKMEGYEEMKRLISLL